MARYFIIDDKPLTEPGRIETETYALPDGVQVVKYKTRAYAHGVLPQRNFQNDETVML